MKNTENIQKSIKILIVDDHPIVRQGLTQLIENEPGLEVCSQAEDAPQAMSILKKIQPDIIIVDILLKDSSGMELIKDIKIRYPDIPILALSMHDESLYAERALRAGAKGYLMKSEATETVIDAIRKILDGHIYLSNNMSSRIVSKMVGLGKSSNHGSDMDQLSDRELEVFELLGNGFSTRRIAQRLHLSIKTIETYRAHIKEKLNLTDATELMQYAIRFSNSQISE